MWRAVSNDDGSHKQHDELPGRAFGEANAPECLILESVSLRSTDSKELFVFDGCCSEGIQTTSCKIGLSFKLEETQSLLWLRVAVELDASRMRMNCRHWSNNKACEDLLSQTVPLPDFPL